MERNHWHGFDYALLGSTLLLAGFGVAMIASATRGTPLGGLSWSALPVRQAIYLAVGLVGMVVVSLVDYRHLQALCWPLYLGNLALLVLVLGIGKRAYGAVRWIDLGVFDLQPSELAKPLLIVTLAGFLSRREERRESFSTFFLSLLFALVPVGLVFVQPDLSTAVVLLVIWLGMVWAAGTRPAYLVGLLFLSVPLGVLAWHYLLADYQKARLLLFLDPYRDLWGGGYNIIQAWTAIGSGGWLGKGYGQGTQSQLHFLPVRHSDFIFAVVCEEFGFLGAMALLVMIFVFLWQILQVASRAADTAGRLMATGIAVGLMFQTLVNVGMNLGVMPVTGLPLPLISYGGSSLLATLLSLGVVESVSIHRRRSLFERTA